MVPLGEKKVCAVILGSTLLAKVVDLAPNGDGIACARLREKTVWIRVLDVKVGEVVWVEITGRVGPRTAEGEAIDRPEEFLCGYCGNSDQSKMVTTSDASGSLDEVVCTSCGTVLSSLQFVSMTDRDRSEETEDFESLIEYIMDHPDKRQ